MKNKGIVLLALAAVLVGGCGPTAEAGLRASGVVEAAEVVVAAEVGGQVAEVLFENGDSVSINQPLLRLTSEPLAAQQRQAQAALRAAQANLAAAESGVAAAETAAAAAETAVTASEMQLQLTLAAARSRDQASRLQRWRQSPPSAFELPGWYFDQQSQIEAAQHAVQEAEAALQRERDNLAEVVADAGGASLAQATDRLLRAQADFLVADALDSLQVAGSDRRPVDETIDDLLDAAEAELDSAQQAFDNLLSSADADDLLEARARLAVAQERLLTAQAELDSLRTGEHALEVQLAAAALAQAHAQRDQALAGLSQAEAHVDLASSAVEQAQSALDLAQSQLDKLMVGAPSAGVITTRMIEPGELLQPGTPAATVARLHDLRITVYLPEDRYGQVSIGDAADVTVDSYPDQIFTAEVIRIADQAEFTPRNVQTVDERRSTVYAVELAVQAGADQLKPGMPADVTFLLE